MKPRSNSLLRLSTAPGNPLPGKLFIQIRAKGPKTHLTLHPNNQTTMKQKHLLAAIAVALSLPTAANAALVTSFTNLDFDSGAVTAAPNFKGFDAPSATEITGWNNLPSGALVDSGVEATGAWWVPYDDKSGFMYVGDGAYNLSTYTIGTGDVFDISMYAKGWTWQAAGGALTVTLFYGADPNLNMIGSFSTGALAVGTTWTQYTSGSIAATPGSIGQTLGIKVVSSGATNSYANFDEIAVNVVPEPSAALLGGLGMLALLRRRRC